MKEIVAAWAEPCSGPGWANTPLWYLVRDVSGALRIECLQPDEQTREMLVLYGLCAAAHGALLEQVRRAVAR
jgi:hypothetical protein